MGLERIGQIIFGGIAVLFLFAALPTLLTVMNGAGITDPILQGASFLALAVFVVVTIYVAFKGEGNDSVPALPQV